MQLQTSDMTPRILTCDLLEIAHMTNFFLSKYEANILPPFASFSVN